jgi:hypothetical protein
MSPTDSNEPNTEIKLKPSVCYNMYNSSNNKNRNGGDRNNILSFKTF